MQKSICQANNVDKYAGVSQEDLVHIYILYIRSVLEYCSVLWHSTLTGDQSQNLEKVQKTCLKVILGSQYENYSLALDTCGLQPLSERREARCLKFGLKCLVPVNPQVLSDPYDTRRYEHFLVNKARKDSHKLSAIPYIQRKLNDHVKNQKKQN
jgi:hypothetical protein